MVTKELDHLYTSVPSSGIGSYASKPCETHRLIPTILIEIMIQPQTHAKQQPWITLTPDNKEDWNQDHETMQDMGPS